MHSMKDLMTNKKYGVLLAVAAAVFDGLYEYRKRAILLGREPS